MQHEFITFSSNIHQKGPSIKDVGMFFRYFDTPLQHVGSFFTSIRWQFLMKFDPSSRPNFRRLLWTPPKNEIHESLLMYTKGAWFIS